MKSLVCCVLGGLPRYVVVSILLPLMFGAEWAGEIMSSG